MSQRCSGDLYMVGRLRRGSRTLPLLFKPMLLVLFLLQHHRECQVCVMVCCARIRPILKARQSRVKAGPDRAWLLVRDAIRDSLPAFIKV